MKKSDREKVYKKYDGRCAYCGKAIKLSEMQIDHMIPLRKIESGVPKECVERMDNYMPACRRCNHYKRSMDLEKWREEISKIPAKLFRDSYIFKVGVDYGFFNQEERTVVFYFEMKK